MREKISLLMQDGLVPDRHEIEQVVFPNTVIVRKNPAAHGVEQNIGKMMRSDKWIVGELQPVGAGNESFQGRASRGDVSL